MTAEHKTKKGYRSFAHSVADKQNKMITFLIENRCVVSVGRVTLSGAKITAIGVNFGCFLSLVLNTVHCI